MYIVVLCLRSKLKRTLSIRKANLKATVGDTDDFIPLVKNYLCVGPFCSVVGPTLLSNGRTNPDGLYET